MAIEQLTFTTKETSYDADYNPVITETIHKVCVFLRYNAKTEALEPIAITEGQKIEFSDSYATDEGHHYESDVYTLRDGVLYLEWANGGSDCDGPLHRYGECKATTIDSDGKPDWETVTSGQQDVYAERMGY